MLIAVDAAAAEPLYLQIRNQIVAGIATGQLEPGQSLPSVRSLASDLGINLHTVNKAYAVLRDEGYVRMRGRAGAVIADPAAADRADADASAQVKMEDDLFKLALAFRARGGARGQFLEAAAAQAARAYGVMEDAEPAPRPTPEEEGCRWVVGGGRGCRHVVGGRCGCSRERGGGAPMSVTSPVIPLLGLLTLVVPLMGVLMALTPYLMPKRECFAVTVPDDAARDPYLRRLKRT